MDQLRAFIDRVEAPPRSLVLLNRSSPDAVRRLLDDLLEGQPVAIEEADEAGAGEDVVALVEDGKIVSTSPLDELLSTVLLINSDLFKTGARELEEVELPDVFEGLSETPFHVRGYPESNKEKLLLIIMSRIIERTAYEHADGTLRASFQRLSRIDDERGTREVYRRLGETETDVHVYGVDDWDPSVEFPVTVHSGTDEVYRRSWFVVFTPDGDVTGASDGDVTGAPDGTHVALVAVETSPNVWDGFWTYRPEFVREIDAYVGDHL